MICLGEAAKASMFENYLNPKYEGMVRDHIKKAFGEVVDAAWVVEQDKLEFFKAMEDHNKAKAEEKSKGKN